MHEKLNAACVKSFLLEVCTVLSMPRVSLARRGNFDPSYVWNVDTSLRGPAIVLKEIESAYEINLLQQQSIQHFKQSLWNASQRSLPTSTEQCMLQTQLLSQQF